MALPLPVRPDFARLKLVESYGTPKGGSSFIDVLTIVVCF